MMVNKFVVSLKKIIIIKVKVYAMINIILTTKKK